MAKTLEALKFQKIDTIEFERAVNQIDEAILVILFWHFVKMGRAIRHKKSSIKNSILTPPARQSVIQLYDAVNVFFVRESRAEAYFVFPDLPLGERPKLIFIRCRK